MGLTGAFQIGRSALTVSQVAIQVAGHNMANAATPGYARQVASLFPSRPDQALSRITLGSGVSIGEVRRQVDEALQARLWHSIAEQAAAEQGAQGFAAVEAALNELGGKGLSSELTSFFSAWSDLASRSETEAVVVQQGVRLAEFASRLRRELVSAGAQADSQLGVMVERADAILGEIAGLNASVAREEVGGARANSLRDRRDVLVAELSELMDVSVVEQASGSIDVHVGSVPVVLGSRSRGLSLESRTTSAGVVPRVAAREDGQDLSISGGKIGGVLATRGGAIDATIARLDAVVAQLIVKVNGLHATGVNAQGLGYTSSQVGFDQADRARALNDPDNRAIASLPFQPRNGGFVVNVRQSGTGATHSVRVNVDLDGIDAAGGRSTADDTSIEDIRASLDAIDGLNAAFAPDGRLVLTADPGFEFSFSEDSSGVLGVIGVNAFFTGTDARTIGVRADLVERPSRLTVGRLVDGAFVENGTALEIVSLQDRGIAELDGMSLRGAWSSAAQRVGVETSAMSTRAAAAGIVRDNLEAQHAAVSGVSLDEEAMNLITFQRQFQGAARFITVIDELTRTLISIV